MPELPEVEVIRRRLAPAVIGRKIDCVEILRPAILLPQTPAAFALAATGRRIEAVRRRGKNLLIDLARGRTVRIHLRMTGHMNLDTAVAPSTRLLFELSGGRRLLFDDPRALGRVHIHQTAELDAALEALGPEPLSRQFTAAWLSEAAARSRQPAKLFLMDQGNVAGLGNIYAAEALFRAKIHPSRPMNRVPPAKVAALHEAIRNVLREAIRSATIAYKRPGSKEGALFTRAVYGREGEPCRVCERSIRRIAQGGRSTYFCSNCQRP